MYHADEQTELHAVMRLCKSKQEFTKEHNEANIRNEKFSSTASEFLVLAPIFLQYCKRVLLPRGERIPQVESMIACLEALEMIQAVKAYNVDPTDLSRAIKKHLDLFIAAYGKSSIRPKHHYSLHLPRQLAHFINNVRP